MSLQEIRTPASAIDQEDDASNKVICRLCRRQFAKYTCPICNVPYCSLTCFRSSSHFQCSETFYKNELKTDIATTPSRTAEERKQMMDLLKRFEEEAAADEDILHKEAFGENDSESEGKVEDSLIERFAGLDIDTLSSEDMWEILTPTEREKFMKALENPASELAQRLLGSEQLEVELERPWWIGNEAEEEQEGKQKRASSRPEPIHIPQSMVKPVPHGHPLIYNLCAICIAYSYIIRHLGIRMLSGLSPTSPDTTEALRLMDLLVPFLSDRRSTTLHPNVGAATTDVYSRFEMGKVNSELLAALLEDTAKLMQPRRVMPVPSQSFTHGDTAFFDTSTHTLIMPICVLSDLIGLCRSGEGNGDKLIPKSSSQEGQSQPPSEVQSKKLAAKLEPTKMRAYQHVVRKLEFYIAHILATPSGVMEAVTEEVMRWSKRVRAEGQSVMSSVSGGVERARKQQEIR